MKPRIAVDFAREFRAAAHPIAHEARCAQLILATTRRADVTASRDAQPFDNEEDVATHR